MSSKSCLILQDTSRGSRTTTPVNLLPLEAAGWIRFLRGTGDDPMMGIFRHADAGYEIAQQCADESGVKIPMQR